MFVFYIAWMVSARVSEVQLIVKTYKEHPNPYLDCVIKADFSEVYR